MTRRARTCKGRCLVKGVFNYQFGEDGIISETGQCDCTSIACSCLAGDITVVAGGMQALMSVGFENGGRAFS